MIRSSSDSSEISKFKNLIKGMKLFAQQKTTDLIYIKADLLVKKKKKKKKNYDI